MMRQWHEDPIQRLVWFTVKTEQMAAVASPAADAQQAQASVTTPVNTPLVEPQALPDQERLESSSEGQ